MKKLVVYILLVFILFSVFTEIQTSWEENEADVGETIEDVSDKASSWFSFFKSKGTKLKEELNRKIEDANTKYEALKKDVEATTDAVQEKRDQLDRALKEIEEAKKALDELLERDGGAEGEGEEGVVEE